ncbi:pyruvate dehydrogenase [acetyl-transferring]-phosphatase 2, mitochondrial [Hydra vulgaris]|uniref:Pyruvate dehydrogenase [acetyl-transferring]-phosphatase 2, mitochondrial n=1 Tax=Hydra vulgaris TaxID=6087 RepID=A0ABM4DP07_HYDVU
MQSKCLKLSLDQWIWGPTAHWKLYYSLKKYGGKWASALLAESEREKEYSGIVKSERNEKCKPCFTKASNEIDANSTYSRQIIIAGVSKNKYRNRDKFCFKRSYSTLSINNEGSITNDEANKMVWCNEKVINIDKDVVSKCHTNQLASNSPNEDQISITQFGLESGTLFTVLDGHGGHLFGEEVKIRLPYYLQAALLNKDYNENFYESVFNLIQNSIDLHIKDEPWMKELLAYVKTSNKEFPLLESSENDNFFKTQEKKKEESIKNAFVKLDRDIINELQNLSKLNKLDARGIKTALSGCCALSAYIVKDEVFIANVGDCRAVLGKHLNNEWSSVQLTTDHTAVSNASEVRRILSKHPAEESRSCIQYGRLLGRLAPLRALGDMQFKLPNEELRDVFKTMPKYNPIQASKTPPYLTAEPEMFHYKLEKHDKFIVLASDGLWDMLSNDEVVELVGAYIEGRQIDLLKERACYYCVPNYEDLVSSDNAFAKDENVASFLIRFALGGYDPNNLRSMLSIPHPDVRLFRDDITVMVIFLNSLNF